MTMMRCCSASLCSPSARRRAMLSLKEGSRGAETGNFCVRPRSRNLRTPLSSSASSSAVSSSTPVAAPASTLPHVAVMPSYNQDYQENDYFPPTVELEQEPIKPSKNQSESQSVAKVQELLPSRRKITWSSHSRHRRSGIRTSNTAASLNKSVFVPRNVDGIIKDDHGINGIYYADSALAIEEDTLEDISSIADFDNCRSDLGGSPTHVTYACGTPLPITSTLQIETRNPNPNPRDPWPVFRLIDEDGQVRPGVMERDSSAIVEDSVLYNAAMADKAYRYMLRLKTMDDILLNAQRQGRISFYMSCRGEEAIHIGAASAMSPKDVVLAQYREAGILMWRGFSVQQAVDQCFANVRDLGKGRQMPIHYGSRELNYHTISSPLGTQIPQAVGVAYKLKFDNSQSATSTVDDKACAVTFFGDGAASTGDFHTACNFAATLEVPMIFFCRNNGFAISTHVQEQYRGDGIISRAPGYDMAAIRVDGNDVFAVNAAVAQARKYAIENSRPVMIEAMTYRLGHHSTSDDSTRYRSGEEVDAWESRSDPLTRLGKLLEIHEWLSPSDTQSCSSLESYRDSIVAEERRAVLKAMQKAEKTAKPDLSTLFGDVYLDNPPHLLKQEREHLEHVSRHQDYYKM